MDGSYRLALPLIAGVLAAVLRMARIREERATDVIWHNLKQRRGESVFNTAMLDGVPDAGRRYLLRAIRPGTPLAASIQLTMHGFMRLKPEANLLPLRAEQILAPPHGFVWRAWVGKGMMRFQGFDRYTDGEGAMRWWLYGFVPIIKAGGPHISRSAAGRLAGEAVWMPSALLPQRGAQWESVDEHTATVQLVIHAETITVTMFVDADGRLQRVGLMRWRDDVGDGTPGYVRFDADQFAEEWTFGGYTVPTRFRAGWKLGDADEFPFFYATINSAVYR